MLNFGSFEKILEDYSSLDRKDLGIILLNAPLIDFSKEDKTTYLTCCRIDQSLISDYCNGKRPIPKNIIANFSKSSALERAKKGIEKEITSCIFDSSKSKILQEVISLIQKDSSISDTQKEHFSEIATMEHLADFLAEVLVYVVQKRDSKNKVVKLPIQNRFFCGRQEILEEVESNFKKGIHSQSLYGLGGLGKTQIALQYAYANLDKYKMIWWLNAENQISLQDGIIDLLKALKRLPKNHNAESEKKAFNEYLSKNLDWLLIYDNAEYGTEEEYQLLRSYYPEGNIKGNILLTTRCGTSFEDVLPIEVPLFSPEEATQFLQKRSGEKDETLAMKLAERLGFLPLALEYATAYIRETPCVGYKEYIDKLNEHSIEVLDHKVGHLDYAYTVREAFHITLDKLFQDAQVNQVSGAASIFLDICAFLAPDGIETRFFALHNELLPNPLRTVIKDDLYCDDMIRKLVKFSLLQVKQSGFSIHRLLQEILIQELPIEIRRRILVCIYNVFREYSSNTYKSPLKDRIHAANLAILHVQSIIGRLIDFYRETNTEIEEELYTDFEMFYVSLLMTRFQTFTNEFIRSANDFEPISFKYFDFFHSVIDFYDIVLKHESVYFAEAIVCCMEYFEEKDNITFIFQQYLRAAKMMHNILFHNDRMSLDRYSSYGILAYSHVKISSAILIAYLRDGFLGSFGSSELLYYCQLNMLAAYEISRIVLNIQDDKNNCGCYGHQFEHETTIYLPRAAILNLQTPNSSVKGLPSNEKEQVYANIRYTFKLSSSPRYEYHLKIERPLESNWTISETELKNIINCPDIFVIFQEPNVDLDTICIDFCIDMGSQYKDVKKDIFQLIISIAEREGNERIKREYLQKLEELNTI